MKEYYEIIIDHGLLPDIACYVKLTREEFDSVQHYIDQKNSRGRYWCGVEQCMWCGGGDRFGVACIKKTHINMEINRNWYEELSRVIKNHTFVPPDRICLKDNENEEDDENENEEEGEGEESYDIRFRKLVVMMGETFEISDEFIRVIDRILKKSGYEYIKDGHFDQFRKLLEQEFGDSKDAIRVIEQCVVLWASS